MAKLHPGKLSISFPVSLGQIPIYYNHKNTGRPYDANQKYTTKYLDGPNEPLFPLVSVWATRISPMVISA